VNHIWTEKLILCGLSFPISLAGSKRNLFPCRRPLRAEIDDLVAQLDGLTESAFTQVVSNFPLVDESVKVQTRHTFMELAKPGTFA